MRCRQFWLLVVGGVAAAPWTQALAIGKGATTGGAAHFETAIRPLLLRRCVTCHGAATMRGGLRLDRGDLASRGGDSGKAWIAGDPDHSLIIRAVSGKAAGKTMPPSGPRLAPAEVKALSDWIRSGAPWPASQGSTAASAHWAFRAPVMSKPPAVRQTAWVRTPVDRFVLSRLEQAAIRPSPEADRETLLRRLSLDLTGLPPTLEDRSRFLGDRRPDAYDQLVDRLLASPAFGERWGRHWLDVARYADSDGYEKDSPRPNAYLYRDWVIRAVNEDVPFDRFTELQLAGDLLPNPSLSDRIATGFHRNTLKNREGGVDPEEDRNKIAVDRTNTTGTVWLGLSVGCAECHTHKYDPIPHREYYQLFAFFNDTDDVEIPAAEVAFRSDKDAKASVLAAPAGPREARIHLRGDFLRPGETVQPGGLSVLPALKPSSARATRLDLARWLVSPENPLTARVAVNRVWQILFGRGIVATPNDFGVRGDAPSHPELLDWLAVTHRTPAADGGLGWSLKRLIRLLVTSATYRQTSATRPDLIEIDPKNVLLARQSRFRVEAEIVRDLHLAASGLLNGTVGGPSIRPPLPADIAALGYAGSVKWAESKGAERYRRGLYVFYQRTVPYPLLATFDAPDSNTSCTRRERSNTAIQALTILNDPVFFECAQVLARRVAAGADSDPERVRLLWRVALSRDPTQRESERISQLQRDVADRVVGTSDGGKKMVGPAPTPELPLHELAGWVAAARTVFNLEEFLTRE